MTEETTPVPAPALTVADIEMTVRALDYAAEQGAFRGWTVIEAVLAVRNRLAAFVQATKPPVETGDAE